MVPNVPILNKLEMPELPWNIIEKGIKGLRKIGMLERIDYVRPAHSPLVSPDGVLINKFARGIPVSLKISVVTLLSRSEIAA